MTEDYIPPIYDDEFVEEDKEAHAEFVPLDVRLPDPPSEANDWRWEGFGPEHRAVFDARRRMLLGDFDGVDLVDRMRFAAERGWFISVHVVDALLVEAADEIVRLRGA